MLNKEYLTKQLESLEAEERNYIAQLHQTRGAQRMCRHLLGMLEREQDVQQAEKQTEKVNGQPAGVN